jgi:hypothetical protein
LIDRDGYGEVGAALGALRERPELAGKERDVSLLSVVTPHDQRDDLRPEVSRGG